MTGSTPAKQETWKFLGTLVSAATVGGVDLDIEPDVRFHDRTIGRSASERYGRRYRAVDEWFRGTLGFIMQSGRPRCRIELLQDTGVGHSPPGMFYPFGPEYAAFDRWSDQLVRKEAVAKTKAELGPLGERYVYWLPALSPAVP